MYYRGEGTKKDRQKALQWFEKAGRGGCTEAWLLCGKMYYKGVGTDKDYAKALWWCEKVVQVPDSPDNAEAKYICGTIYAAGEGVEKDREKGLLLVREAAGQGYRPAKFALRFRLSG